MRIMENHRDQQRLRNKNTESTVIHINRKGEDLGCFVPETVNEYLHRGILKPDDWAFCEGLKDWMKLGELFESDLVNTPEQQKYKQFDINSFLPAPCLTATKASQKKALLTAAVGVGAFILILYLFTSTRNSKIDSYTPPDTTFKSDPLEATPQTGSPYVSPYAVSPPGNQLQGGISAAELSGLVGASLPSGQGQKYYEREIAAGIQAYDGNYKLSPTDKRVIENMARELGK